MKLLKVIPSLGYYKKLGFIPNWFSKMIFLNTSLKWQLLSVLVLVSLVPTILVGVISYRSTAENINTEKLNTLRAYSEGISGNVAAKIESTNNLIKGLSSHSDIMVEMENFNKNLEIVDTARVNSVLFSLKNVIDGSGKLYETVFITDVRGKIVMDGSKYINKYSGRQFYDMSDFELIKKGSDVIVGSPIISEATGKLLLPVSRPIKSLAGFMGVMTIMFDLEKFTADFEQIKPGKTGKVIVINNKNMIVYHTDKNLINAANKNNIISNLMNKEENILKYKSEGEERITFYNRASTVDWLICTEMAKSEFTDPIERFSRVTIIVIAAVAIIAVIVSVIYSGYISKPVVKLIQLMRQVESGDLNISTEFKASVNEIKDLKNGFSDMVKNLKTLINGIMSADSQINTAMLQMTSVSQNSLAHAEHTMNAVDGITASIQEQTGNIGFITSDIEKLAERIKTAKDLSDGVSVYSKKVNQYAENGIRLVDVLRKKSDENIKNTEMVDSVIKLLNEEIVEVNKIAKTISNIASQTNLLSLNATIEAARTGEMGKGFSVVANEIKKLSNQTKAEASEINKLIINIQSKAENVVSTMQNASNSAEEQNSAVVDTGESFDEIYRSVKDISYKIGDITSCLDEMNHEKDTIVKMVREINGISEQVAYSAEDVHSYSESQIKLIQEVHECADVLHKMAYDLNKSVKTFKP